MIPYSHAGLVTWHRRHQRERRHAAIRKWGGRFAWLMVGLGLAYIISLAPGW